MNHHYTPPQHPSIASAAASDRLLAIKAGIRVRLAWELRTSKQNRLMRVLERPWRAVIVAVAALGMRGDASIILLFGFFPPFDSRMNLISSVICICIINILCLTDDNSQYDAS
ncbi:hypothetical protein E2C01_013387 [Portunus trituberculatus]|uniref:Uncharacterized protein n=1 Tax=Portunus trituberculatus TaxID=210409 RepID=A0A5B7DGW3_PORTR|nr:hypothetical protein [Portunus trituberculatus]